MPSCALAVMRALSLREIETVLQANPIDQIAIG